MPSLPAPAESTFQTCLGACPTGPVDSRAPATASDNKTRLGHGARLLAVAGRVCAATTGFAVFLPLREEVLGGRAQQPLRFLGQVETRGYQGPPQSWKLLRWWCWCSK